MADETPQTPNKPVSSTQASPVTELKTCPVCDRIHTADETGPCARCGYLAE